LASWPYFLPTHALAACHLSAVPPCRIHFLLVRNEDEVFGQLAVLLAALLDALASDSERVVLQALSVLGSIAGHAQHFRRVLMSLLDRWGLHRNVMHY
jgi:hypothetical protein